MAVLSIREIYDAARDAGFTPHQAVTWTAIAMAESRGRTGALNDRGEHSVGLWQINVAGDVRKNSWGDLTKPEVNARAAYEISRQGTDMRPWTTTHDHNKGTGADYRTYLGKVEAEIGVKGDPRGVSGYGAPRPKPLPESAYGGDPAPAPVAEPDPSPGGSATGADSDADGLTDAFEKQIGTNARAADSDADGFTDAYEALVTRTDPLGAGNTIRDADTDGLADVTERLLGSRTTDTDSDNDKVADGVEVSLGLNPTRVDSDSDGLTDAAEAKAGSAFDIDPGTAIGAPGAGGIDSDRDGLTDAFEQLSGSTPTQGDTDGDRVPDAVEAALGTNPRLADTDQDGVLDAAELGYGSDPRGPGQALGVGPVGPAPAGVAAGPPSGGSDVFDPD
jgi:hypothetical protein